MGELGKEERPAYCGSQTVAFDNNGSGAGFELFYHFNRQRGAAGETTLDQCCQNLNLDFHSLSLKTF